ncbi:quinolinate synthase NadA [Shigella flexneri]
MICSLDLGCPVQEFNAFCDAHPDRTARRLRQHCCCGKSARKLGGDFRIAVELTDHLDSSGEKIIWEPDKHLGRYVQKQTAQTFYAGRVPALCMMNLRLSVNPLARRIPGCCHIGASRITTSYCRLADAVGSTNRLIAAAKTLPHQRLIVATDPGIFYKMQQAVPDKELGKHDPRVRAQPPQLRALSVDGHEWPSGYRRGIRTGRKQSRGSC